MSVQLSHLSSTRGIAAAAIAAGLLLGACGSDSSDSDASQSTGAQSADTSQTADASDAAADGLRLVSAAQGSAIAENPPADLVVLDVRTPEEFDAGHIEGAVLVDFYDDDFADQLAELDPDVPYLLYCNSGNRSGQTVPMLADLGFTDVAEVDGGIQAWNAASLPLAGG